MNMFCMYLIVTGVLRIQRRSLGSISASAITYSVLLRLQVLKLKHHPVLVEVFAQFIFKFTRASFIAYF